MLVDRAVDDLEFPLQDPPREVLEMPLNYPGLRLVRYGIDGAAPPPDVSPPQVAAVGTWFSVGMVALMGVSILYNTQQILRAYPAGAHVAASVNLFASLMTMFWYILRIFASRD